MFKKIFLFGIFLFLISSVYGYTALDARQGLYEAVWMTDDSNLCELAIPEDSGASWPSGESCIVNVIGEWDFEKVNNGSDLVWWGDEDFEDLGFNFYGVDLCFSNDLDLAFCDNYQGTFYSPYFASGFSSTYIEFYVFGFVREDAWAVIETFYDCNIFGFCNYTESIHYEVPFNDYPDVSETRVSTGVFTFSEGWRPSSYDYIWDGCSILSEDTSLSECSLQDASRKELTCGGGLWDDVTNIVYEVEGRCCEDLDNDGYDNCNIGEDGGDSYALDCDDEDSDVYESVTCYEDGDGDGFGTGSSVSFCGSSCSSGYSDNGDDCDDTDPLLTDNCPDCNFNTDCDDSDPNTLDACVGGFCQNKEGSFPGLCDEDIDFLRAHCEEPEDGVVDALKVPDSAPCANRGSVVDTGGYVIANSSDLSSDDVEVGEEISVLINLFGNNSVSGVRAADIMYVVDKSGSMAGGPMGVAINAVNGLDGFFADYNSNSGDDAFKVGLATFNHDAVIESHLADAGSSVSVPNACGCTGIGGGVNHSIMQDFEDSSLSCSDSSVSKVLVLFSDGMENRAPLLSSIKAGVPNDITFYTIGVTGISSLEAALKDVVTWGTGDGLYYSIPDINDLEDIYKRIAEIYTSDSSAAEVIVRVTLNESFDYLSSDYPVIVNGDDLEWRFSNLSVGELRSLNLSLNVSEGSGLTDIFSFAEVEIHNPAGKHLIEFDSLDVLIGGVDPSFCVLTDAYWEKLSAFEGEEVELIVEGENCNGVRLNFSVFENDNDMINGDDSVSVNPSDAVFVGSVARVNWTVEYQGDGIDGDPEYYFVASNGSNIIDSGEDEEKLLNVYQMVDTSNSYWADMDDNPLFNADKNDLVKLVANSSESFDGRNLEFKIYRDGDEIEILDSISQYSDWAYMLWRPPSDGGYTFEVYDADDGSLVAGESALLDVSGIRNDPSIVIFQTPDCGYYNFTETEVVVNVSLRDKDDFLNGSIDFGDGAQEEINSSEEKWSFSHIYSNSGSYSISVFVSDGRGNEEVSFTNIMIVRPGVEGQYLAACISEPENYGDVGEGTVEFDASDTVALNYSGSGSLEDAVVSLTDSNTDDDDLFSFEWEFSDGGENPYKFGNETLSYKFYKEYLTPGRNWANVAVSFD